MGEKQYNLLIGENKKVADWVAKRISGTEQAFGKYVAIGVLAQDEKKLIAGFVFHNYHPEFSRIELGVAADSPAWANKETMRKLFYYPFEKLKVNKLFVLMGAKNKKGIQTAEHAGFKREAILADEFGKGHHGVRLRMLTKEYKKIRGTL